MRILGIFGCARDRRAEGSYRPSKHLIIQVFQWSRQAKRNSWFTAGYRNQVQGLNRFRTSKNDETIKISDKLLCIAKAGSTRGGIKKCPSYP